MFSDWISSYLRAQPAPDPAPEPAAAVQSLADGVQQLCTLCEELLVLVSLSDAAQDVTEPLLRTIPAQIEAVRACAGEIKSQRSAAPAESDPYSLAALGQWVWRE
ncbi:MAG: hypothetical protein JO250_10895 [Armatimonadetes bacterium]|nr:hypothetical protein [Armatimonadota bacterium]